MALALILILLLNIPFGYWRANVKKFSFQWVLSVHLPVPFVAAVRIFGGFGWQLSTFAFFIPAFFLGQYIGQLFYSYRKSNNRFPLTSCLVMDLSKSVDGSKD
ncbi:MAG: hypothetical protein KKA84_03475 [Bacteroidetes bacterium]|nr:hypothetical protein [Bacteroidota bacterium]